MSPSNIVHRAQPVDLELRGSDGRTVVGICAPFNQAADISERGYRFSETIRPGSFAKTIAERGDRVKFLALHDARSMPLGRATLLREDASGLYGEFRVSKTQAGDEVLELINDGALDALSVGMRVISDTWNRDHTSRSITEIALAEVSAVNFGAYSGAVILGTRSHDTNVITPEQAARRLRLLDL
ncbi:HK97 family phage prohead protease [Rhodococcus sp. SORGH_AS_0303]|uniref:HK97 family phage prohead protease n=1 Tax=Rhodococcus sp. SORGH_AS_0303 TaxID=3041753 RepID=UPI0027860EF0|nr:HK97 family phage prohead protease [Rhodococcus sp. SORGH_AS_0303]MDQ1202719.1 HK97 family phage prohead protease [Rhodococcus sp. SORGH_AS_0303]